MTFSMYKDKDQSNCAAKHAGMQGGNRKTNEIIESLPIRMRMGYNLLIDWFHSYLKE